MTGWRRHRTHPPRVLILIENLPAPFDRRVWQEATTLRDAGYDVTIVCPKGRGFDAKYEVIDDIRIHRHPLPIEARSALGYVAEYATALFWELLLACKVFLSRGFDVIHACNPPDLLFLIGLVFRPFGVRFVFDHHDINPELFEAKFGRKGVLYALVCWLERMTFRSADCVISTNESYRKIALERGGVVNERVHVVRSGPSLERLVVHPGDASHRHGKKYLVGYVGVMAKQDGLHHLLGAARRIVHEHGRRDIHFGLVGNGPEFDELLAMRTRYGLDDFVTFTGRVSDREMLDVLNTADICVNPDVYNAMNDKSTMNKVMEYMALGKPIVQFDLTEGKFSAAGASVYAARNDEADLAAKIIELLEDPDRRVAMGRVGRDRVERLFEWRHEAPKLLDAYATLFPDMRRRHPGAIPGAGESAPIRRAV